MKNEAGLRPMKRARGTRRGAYALRFISERSERLHLQRAKGATLLLKNSHFSSLIMKRAGQIGICRGKSITKQKYRKFYEIYPGKICIDENAGICKNCIT